MNENKLLFSSSRMFAPYDFLVSHRQLLLRSDKIKGYPSNIDVIFFGVMYMELPSTLDSISISEIPADQVTEKLQIYPGTCYRIQTSNNEFYIVANDIKVFKNQLDLPETSLGVLECIGRDEEIALPVVMPKEDRAHT